MFSVEVKEFHANLLAEPLFLQMIREMEAEVAPLPRWTPVNKVSETETAYWSGFGDGQGTVIQTLRGNK